MGERKVDQELVARVQKGEKKAFDILVLKYQQKITNLISRYIRDPHEVLDVTQEAFIKAYRAIPKFRGDSAFYTWLYRIAINTAKNYLVAQGRRPPSDDVEAEVAAVDDAPAVVTGHFGALVVHGRQRPRGRHEGELADQERRALRRQSARSRIEGLSR